MPEPIRAPEMSMPRSCLDDTDIQDHIRDFKRLGKFCPRFRVLIVGKANAGKTTILKKMCGTAADETPVVHDMNGVLKEMYGPGQFRGFHDIEDEITFESNPGFVFHDSCGFEAGSSGTLDKAKAFIEDRSATGRLRSRLHAIWFCVPMDATRPISQAELSFFEIITGGVPVIAVFTKFDALIDKSFTQLRKEGMGRRGAKERALGHANELFEKNQLTMINEMQHPPKSYVCLSNMQLPDTSCADLTTNTANVLDDDVIMQLFVTVQRNNLALCIDKAIQKVILREYVKALREDYVLDTDKSQRIMTKVVQWFPQIFVSKWIAYMV